MSIPLKLSKISYEQYIASNSSKDSVPHREVSHRTSSSRYTRRLDQESTLDYSVASFQNTNYSKVVAPRPVKRYGPPSVTSLRVPETVPLVKSGPNRLEVSNEEHLHRGLNENQGLNQGSNENPNQSANSHDSRESLKKAPNAQKPRELPKPNIDLNNPYHIALLSRKKTPIKAGLVRRATRKSNWKSHIAGLNKKLKLKFRNWKHIARRLVRKRLKRLAQRNATGNSDISSNDDLANDERFLQKYAEKKIKKRLIKKKSKLRVKSLKRKAESSKGGSEISSTALEPPVISYSAKRDFSAGSQLTIENVEKLVELPDYKPIKRDIIEKYVCEVSEDIQDKMEKSLIDTDTHLDSQEKYLDETVISTIQSAKALRKDSMEIERLNVVTRKDSTLESASASTKEPVKNKSYESMKTNVNDEITTSHSATKSVDAAYDRFIDNWSSYLKSAIAQRTVIKLEISHSDLHDQSAASEDDGMKRLSVLDAILGTYTDEESDTETVTESSLNRSNTTAETVFSPFPSEKLPVAQDNASLRSNSTVDSEQSIKTSSFSDSQTHYFSIENVSDAAGEKAAANDIDKLVVEDDEEIEADLTRHSTVLIRQQFHGENGNQKFIQNSRSILDILSVQESLSDIDNALKNSGVDSQAKVSKALSEMSRASSLSSSINVSPLNFPKKYSSMNDMNRFKLENNLRAVSLEGNVLPNRSLSTRYNRKTNNAAIIRFLSQNGQTIAE